MKIDFNPFGPKAYSYRLVHYMTYYEEIACGASAQHGPVLTVDQEQPVSCLHCLVLGDPRRNG